MNNIATNPARGVVPFLFGVADTDELPGVVLNRLLVDIGLTPSAAHALLARMRREGLLASTRHGRSASYRLAGPMAGAFRRARDYSGRPATPWTGSFHAVLYQVPEGRRDYRDALRRAATMSGYGRLQAGVLIAPADRSAAITDTIARAPAGARVISTTLGMDTATAAMVAFDAWELGDLARTYRHHVARLRQALADHPERPAASAETLRVFADLVRAPMSDTARDPGLPAELLPEGWEGDRLGAAIGETSLRFGPPAAAYVADVLDCPGRPRGGEVRPGRDPLPFADGT